MLGLTNGNGISFENLVQIQDQREVQFSRMYKEQRITSGLLDGSLAANVENIISFS